MAEIKIEKKGGSLWWLWALIALVVLGILLWVFLDNDRSNGVVEAPAVATAPAQATGEPEMSMVDRSAADTRPITDLATIAGGNDAALVGRDVRVSNVPVGEMAGDASFWVNDANGNRTYVVLNEVATPGTPIEGRVNVNKGDKVDLVGTLRSASEGAPEGAAMGTKTDPLPSGITQYIYAQSAKVVS